jgi:cell division transport system permease protein
MLKRSIVEGLKNASRSLWLSMTAIVVLTVSLASVALVIGLSVTVGYTVRNLDALVSFPAFFKENVTEDAITTQILPKIKSNPKVKTIEYFDKDKARKKLEAGSVGFVSSYLSKEENYAWRYVLITPDKSEDYSEVVQNVKEGEYKDLFDSVPVDKNFVDQLLKFYNYINLFGIALIVIFSLISVLVMSNVLRMTIYSHREEIEILRLVGATNNYIRGPFIAQGIFYNIISSIIVVVAYIVVVSLSLPILKNWFFGSLVAGGDVLISNLNTQLYLSLVGTVVISILIGIATIYASIQRYLKV